MAQILFVSHTSQIGGPTNRLLTLLKYLRQEHQSAVVAPDHGALFEALEEIGAPGYAPGRRGLTRRAIPWLCRLILRGGFDIVYGNNYSSGPRNALIAAKLTGRPFIWHINEMLKESEPRRMVLFLRCADVLIADSKASAQSVQRHVPTRIVHQIYNGIELDEFQSDVADARRHVRSILGVPEDQLVIVAAGLVCARKGQAYGVRAAMDILGDHPEAVFAFLGDLDTEPEYAQSLRAKVAKSALGDRIQFLGFRKDFDLFLRGCDVFLHTAARDPHPIAVLSAMGARLPVVAFAVDGVKEQVVNGETGYLITFGDMNAMVEALKACLEDPSLRRRMGEMGRQRVQAMFTAEEMGKRVAAVINSLLSG